MGRVNYDDECVRLVLTVELLARLTVLKAALAVRDARIEALVAENTGAATSPGGRFDWIPRSAAAPGSMSRATSRCSSGIFQLYLYLLMTVEFPSRGMTMATHGARWAWQVDLLNDLMSKLDS